MFDKVRARDCLLNGEFEISYVADLPIVDLTPLRTLLPPGHYYPLEDLRKMLKQLEDRLIAMSPHTKGSYAIGIAADLSTVVLARTPSPQGELNLDGNADATVVKSLGALAEEEVLRARQAISAAQAIQQSHQEGEVRTIEELRNKLGESQNPELTLKALQLAGRERIILTDDNQEVATGGGEPFPSTLESSDPYVMELEIRSGTDEVEKLAYARALTFSRDDETSQALLSMVKIPSRYLDPAVGHLLVAAQFSGARVKAEASVTVGTFTDRPTELTLRRILNKREIVEAIKKVVEQGDLYLDA
jgi:hypothetical protein